MSKQTIVFISAAVFVLICVLWVFSIFNGEIALRNRLEGQTNAVATTHDTMWKTLSQQYSISEDYRETFIDGLKAVAVGRQGGAIFKSSTEANSQLGLSSEIFTKLMNTIEGKREELKRSQDTLTDIWREHTTYCQSFPNTFFVGGRVTEKPKMITSTRTEDAIEQGRDDNIDFKPQ